MAKLTSLDGFIVEVGGMKNGYFTRKKYLKHNEAFGLELDKIISGEFNSTDVYICMYNYENDDIDHCKMLGDFYLDFDADIEDEAAFNELRKEVCMVVNYFVTYWSIPKAMLRIYFSGHKGFHLIVPWMIWGLQPDAELNMKFKLLAKLIAKQCNAKHLDLGIYDRKRLFRVPGSINSKSGLHKVPLSYEQLAQFTLEEMIEWAGEPRYPDWWTGAQYIQKSAEHYKELFRREALKSKLKKHKKKKIELPKKRQPLLPCVVEILKLGVSKGQRNNTTVALASSLMQSGIKRDEAEDILLDWNQNNDPPLPESELVHTISSAYRTLCNGMGYGCQTFKDLGYCIGKTCKIAKKL